MKLENNISLENKRILIIKDKKPIWGRKYKDLKELINDFVDKNTIEYSININDNWNIELNIKWKKFLFSKEEKYVFKDFDDTNMLLLAKWVKDEDWWEWHYFFELIFELDFYREQREIKFKELMDKLWLYYLSMYKRKKRK